MNDYNSQEAVDNDDDSCYYNTHHNFFPFSSAGLKNDFGGHDNHHHHNMYINDNTCMHINPQVPGHEDEFSNNTCVIFASNPVYANYDTELARPIMTDNRVFTVDGKATESGLNVSAMQAQGFDLGTTVAVIPEDNEIIALARALLNL